MSEPKKAIILGGGITGLSAGWKLAEAGYAVYVIEKSQDLGGMSGTFQHGEYRLDYGPHKIFTVLEHIDAELKGLFSPGELLTIKKQSRVRLRGKYLKFPLGLADIFLGLGILKGLQCGWGYALSLVRGFLDRREATSYETWVVQKFGRPIYDLVLGPYAQKVWGPPQNLSRSLAESRIAAPNLMEMVAQMILGKRKKAPVINADTFEYPKLGALEISLKMAGKIKQHQGRIGLGRTLTPVAYAPGQKECPLLFSDGSQERLNEGDVVISTIPLPELIALFQGTLPAGAQEAVKKLRTRRLILLYVILKRDRFSDDNWLFFPEAQYRFNRVFEQKAFSPTMLPPGKTALCAEITCDEEDPIWTMEDAKLFETVSGQFKEAGLIQEDVLEVFTQRVEHGYPIYDLGYEEHLAVVRSALNQIPFLYSVGRQGGFSYTGMADSMDIGFSTAQFIIQRMNKAKDWMAYSSKFYNYLVVD